MLRIGLILKDYRWASKQTLRGLAAQIGIGHSTLGRLEQGKGGIKQEHLAHLLRWLLEEVPSGS